ncbi:MAG: M3 family metallopeptidase [Burkholderiales bacterium]|nr:M3 family metallopeptidase [Burkholderiales bacterium]
MKSSLSSSNPLLVAQGLPLFSEVRPEHVADALAERIRQARAVVQSAIDVRDPPTWENLVLPISDALDRLDVMWHVVSHFNAVVNTHEWRDAYNLGLPILTAFHTDLQQDERLFARYTALHESDLFNTLSPAQQTAVAHTLRDFRLGGVALPPEQRARFKDNQEAQATLSATFDDHVLDATQAFSLFVHDKEELDGLPLDVITKARETATQNGEEGYRLTLLFPCYQPVMRFAKNRQLRATLHRAYLTRASELAANPERDNAPIIRQLLNLREEEAHLLGFPHYGALSLVPKMAKSVDEVIAFLKNLAARAKPFAQRDLNALTEFARDQLNLTELLPHDLAFVSEKLKEQNYAFSDEEVRQYFPIEKVLAGLFSLTRELYGVTLVETPAQTWHPDVRHFELRDPADEVIGRVYLDLYARDTKQGGAWMGGALPLRRLSQDHAERPIAYLTMNFAGAVGGFPATLRHDDVTTLFHEFGHGLHHLLTHEATPGVSGMENFEWDAVELPSQFMENFCYEWETLQAMSEHIETKKPLPRELFDKMTRARHFQSGLFLLRQIEFALFDMLLHTLPAPVDYEKVLADVRREIAVVPTADYDRFANTFGHIFAGGYAAGYYSYLHAEVLSSDVYSFFEKQDTYRHTLGQKFRDELLGRGSARPALESFIAFCGRAPNQEAFLRHHGLVENA